jgi:hypothetical protein
MQNSNVIDLTGSDDEMIPETSSEEEQGGNNVDISRYTKHKAGPNSTVPVATADELPNPSGVRAKSCTSVVHSVRASVTATEATSSVTGTEAILALRLPTPKAKRPTLRPGISRECRALDNDNYAFRRICTRTLLDVVFVTEQKGDSRQSDAKGYGVVARENLARGEHFYDPAVRWKRGKPPEDLDPFFYVVVKDGYLQLAAPNDSPWAFKSTTYYINEAKDKNQREDSKKPNVEYFLRRLPDGDRWEGGPEHICELRITRTVKKDDELVSRYDSRRRIARACSSH